MPPQTSDSNVNWITTYCSWGLPAIRSLIFENFTLAIQIQCGLRELQVFERANNVHIVCMHAYPCMYVCMCVCMCVCMHVWLVSICYQIMMRLGEGIAATGGARRISEGRWDVECQFFLQKNCAIIKSYFW